MALADPDFFTPFTRTTPAGLTVTRTAVVLNPARALDPLIDALDTRRGLLMRCGVDAPGRYRQGAVGFTDPLLAVTARARTVVVEALNPRGRRLLPVVRALLEQTPAVDRLDAADGALSAHIAPQGDGFAEEERSRQPSVFSVLRALRDGFAVADDPYLGLYGAFGYDLAFQFEAIRPRLERADDQRDLVLYLPDAVTVIDPAAGVARRFHYAFHTADGSTADHEGGGQVHGYRAATNAAAYGDHGPGEYAAVVRTALAAFGRGDLFEAVPGQVFGEPCADSPATVFRRLIHANPAPYEALINLGHGEFLVAASPEMYVRVTGRRVETCPISGTVARGADALSDARQIFSLLSNPKEEAELTMCTDVDRNDKARVCEPGSVRVIGRRLIEMYSRLIHTVDHVEGRLRGGFDALDAFLTHTWAVTVTGAPKRHAMQFVEDHERTARRWYAGAFGRIGFDGGLETGLTLRTIRMKDGIAEVRAGATLLSDSDPDAEDAECRLKASALLGAIRGDAAARESVPVAQAGAGRRVLLVDHDDSFVLMLADYLRQTGAEVTTLRHTHARTAVLSGAYDLVVLSPGPGRPADFDVAGTVDAALSAGAAVFGVCLGLQGIVERFGGALDVLPRPMHGKPSVIRVDGDGVLFAGLPERVRVGRYHSLHARACSIPAALAVTAQSEDGVVMAVEHRTLPVAAVQFHPESLMTLDGGTGMAIVANVLSRLHPAGAVRQPAAA